MVLLRPISIIELSVKNSAKLNGCNNNNPKTGSMNQVIKKHNRAKI